MNTDYGVREACDVAIIGAGASGTLLAIQLLRQSSDLLKIVLLDRSENLGRGIAYRTQSSRHLLNVPAGRMGASPDEPDGFVKWLESHPDNIARAGVQSWTSESFLPRRLYGEYLRDLLDAACRESAFARLSRRHGEALDVEPRNGRFEVTTSEGPTLLCRELVLATGNFAPGDPPLRDRRFHESRRYLGSPWSEETIDRLFRSQSCLLLGSGLTAMDVILALDERGYSGTIHVLSRRGLWPRAHAPAYRVDPPFTLDSLPTTARAALRMMRQAAAVAEAAGGDWRAVVDSVRPFTQATWQNFSEREQRRFLRHVRAYWEVHRHRAAPEALGRIAAMQQAGRVQLHAGRLTKLEEQGDQLLAKYVARGAFADSRILVDRALNCTGPECNYYKLKDPLIINMFARGLIAPDPLFLGLETDANGALADYRGKVCGNLHTLGSARRGSLFETTAIPEIRVQARDLARQLLRRQQEAFAVSI
jgi:uncharacterized NAD(P)/FAD-binding protein YdhS